MSTPVENFAKVTVSAGYGAGDTTIVLATGHGSRLPSTFPYPLAYWNSTDYADPSDDPNREIVTVTNRTGDTLTVTRAAEGTTATAKNTGGKTYKMALGITKAMWQSLEQRALSQSFRGLNLRTHPSADLAASTVLLNAGAIVMSDGEEVANWVNVTADMAASGAGGIDTGSEQASTWYELYALYNGTTKSLCVHRAKDYFLDEDIGAIVTEDATQGIRSAVDNSTVKVAQGFQVDQAGPVEFIDVKLIKVGTPTGHLWFTIEANSGGVPSNTPLATTIKIDVSRLLTTATTIRIPILTPASLSAATQYHLVAQGDYTISATNYVGWRMDGSAATYTKGAKALFNSGTSTWTTDTDDDLLAKIYVTRNDVAFSTTVPTGYRYALVGYAYNNSGSALIEFIQLGQRWRLNNVGGNGQVINETAAALTLIDLQSLVPPLYAVQILLTLTGTGAAAASASIGPISATDMVNASLTGVGEFLFFSGGSESQAQGFSPLIITYSALMIDATSGADLYYQGFDW